MEVKEVKGNLGKEVLFKARNSGKLSKYILNAYIFRVDPRDSKKRLKQAELQDIQCPHSVLIAKLEDVTI